MLKFFVFITSSLFITYQVKAMLIPKMTVYFETICPICAKFVTDQLTLTLNTFNTELEFVPCGLATLNGSDYVCPHGPEECLGNKLIACFIDRYPNHTDQKQLIFCAMTSQNPPRSIRNCTDKLGYDYTLIDRERCNDTERIALMTKHCNRTQSIDPPLTEMPIVSINTDTNEPVKYFNVDEIAKILCNFLPGGCAQNNTEDDSQKSTDKSLSRREIFNPKYLLQTIFVLWKNYKF